MLSVTSGLTAIGALRQASASYSVNAACAASSCPAASIPSSSINTQLVSDVVATQVSSSSRTTATTTSSSSSTPKCGSDGSECEDSDQPEAAAVSADPDSQKYNASGSLTVDYYTPTPYSDDPTDQTVGLLAESAPAPALLVVACPASSLGYQCSQQVAEGVRIHYSSVGAGQPGNSCTQGTGLDTTLGNETSLLHLAIESTLSVRA